MRSIFLVAIANAPMFGCASLRKLRAAFFTWEEVWNASRTELLASGVEEKRIDAFCAWRQTCNPNALFETLQKHAIRIITPNDPEYPSLLKEIYDPPEFLFVQGALLAARPSLAMVGSRHASTYGKEAAHGLAFSCAQAGISIVSGGAYGIDEASHRGTIDAHGHTACVLATGILGSDNPRQTSITQAILAANGTIVSEFPLGESAKKFHFPLRNRIVAGMCRATLVVEAALPSGSMITADAATKENREVCAVPGPITSITSKGTNFLIKNGAHCITESADIFSIFELNVAPNTSATIQCPSSCTPEEQRFFAALSVTPTHIDDVAIHANISPTQAAVAATTLELLGVIRDVGGKRFVLARSG